MPLNEETRVRVVRRYRGYRAELVSELAKAVSRPQVRAMRRIVEGEQDETKRVTYWFTARVSKIAAEGISAAMMSVLMQHLLTDEKGSSGIYRVSLSEFGREVLAAAEKLGK